MGGEKPHGDDTDHTLAQGNEFQRSSSSGRDSGLSANENAAKTAFSVANRLHCGPFRVGDAGRPSFGPSLATVARALHHPEKPSPRPDSFAVLDRHNSRNLMQVREIV